MNQVQYNALVEKLAGEIVEEAVMEKEASFASFKAGARGLAAGVASMANPEYQKAKKIVKKVSGAGDIAEGVRGLKGAKKYKGDGTGAYGPMAAAARKKLGKGVAKATGVTGAAAGAGYAASRRKKEASVEEVAFEKAASTYEDAQILKQAAMEVLAEAELYEDAAIEVLAELGYFGEEHLAEEYEEEDGEYEYEDEDGEYEYEEDGEYEYEE